MSDRHDSVAARIAATLDAIAAREPSLRAFRGVDAAGAHARAAALDALPEAERGPLHGVPVGLKELFDRSGRKIGWGSPIHADRIAATDSDIVRRLEAAGAVIIGETISTEYAIAAAGPTRNPHDPDRTPGGSSSGSAAAVGAGLLPLAVGSQTVGSVVRPAAYCGVVGVKPSHGALPLDGAMPLSPSLDTVGFLASDVALATRALAAVGVPLPADPPVARLWRVAPWYPEPTDQAQVEALDRAERALSAGGLPVEAVSLPEAVIAEEAAIGDTILCVEAARAHADALATSADRMSAALRTRLARGAATPAATYDAAIATRDAMRAALLDWLPDDVALLAPPATGPAPAFGQNTGERAPQRLWTTLGWPAVSVPVPGSEPPLGAQLIAGPGRDGALLALAARLEAAMRPG